MKVFIYGATWCTPCEILKNWITAGGLSGLATSFYVDIDSYPNSIVSKRLEIGEPTLGEYYPAIVIQDENDNLIAWKNGGTQTWIQSNLNETPVNNPFFTDDDFGNTNYSTPSDAPKKKLDNLLNFKTALALYLGYKILKNG